MNIDHPTLSQIPQLRSLWKEAFGDTDAFLDIFFHRAFSPDRCRCLTRDGQVLAALYWFDCDYQGKKMAYLYAVATAKSHRGQGLCKALLANTHAHLKKAGYLGCLLCPQSDSLFSMYGKSGYQVCSHIREFSCTAGLSPLTLTPVSPEEYAAARRSLLPEGGVLQEGVTLDFLSVFARFYTGPGICLACYPDEGSLVVCELLGSPEAAPGILCALGFSQGKFRIPGQEKPRAMFLPLTANVTAPDYFGLALD